MPTFTLFKQLFLLLLLSLPILITAQNHPCAAIPLPSSMENPSTFEITGLNNSSIPLPICTDNITADIWFETTVPADGFINIATFIGSITNAGLAIYQGDCTNLEELGCILNNPCDNNDMPALHYYDLIPGSDIFIRVWPLTTNSGSFNIQVNATPSNDLNLITLGSAFINDDNCTQLTSDQLTQVGCAWYPDVVDFSEPLEFHVSIYLGDNDGGADGLCLIFQNNSDGTNSCGTSGQNIAATGIDNSFIIEFDTWNNGPGNNDLPEDHTAISINGDLTAPINGPVALPNLEDDQFHDVRVTWDPATNQYELFVDNTSVLQGVFDIIANCFDGDPEAFIGFSGATGGAVNNQIVCAPPIPVAPTSTVVITETSICEGDEIILEGEPQTTAGLYIDHYAIETCDSVVYTHLSILEKSYHAIENTICAGDTFFIGTQGFYTQGTHEAVLTNVLGCDSVVTLQLHLIGPQIAVAPIIPLDCHNTVVTLDGSASFGSDDMVFEWSTTDGCIISPPNQASIQVNCEGTYQLSISDANIGCTNTQNFTVTSHLMTGFTAELVHTNCFREYGSITIPDVEGGLPPFQFSINGGDDFYDYNTFHLLPPANYEIIVQDANDCQISIDTSITLAPEGIIALEEDAFIYQGESYQIEAFTNLTEETIDTIIWSPNNTLSCSDCLTPIATPSITTDYFLTIIDNEGCITEATITIYVDQRPLIFVPNVFSPNKDGNNDILTIFSNHPNVVQINTFEIYDRWGSLVFANTNFFPNDIAQGWTGITPDATHFNSSVFVWQATIQLIDGREVTYKGDTAIIR